MSFSRTLPNELLHGVFCDVLGAYVHFLILTPATRHASRWHGHYSLRSVSKRFKAIVDGIWVSGVGSPETCKREIRKLQTGISTGFYEGPNVSTTPSLLCAYGAYTVASILSQDDEANIESAQKAYEGKPFDLHEVTDWYLLAEKLRQSVRPSGLGAPFGQVLFETAFLYGIEVAVRGIKSVFLFVDLPDKAEAVSLISYSPFGSSFHFTKCLPIITIAISFLIRKLKLTTRHIRRINPSLILNLKEIARTYDASKVVESVEAHDSVRIRQEFSEAAVSLSDLWSKETERANAHKLAMYRSIRFGTHDTKSQD
ncbi:hypothetical protein M408DRAFT_105405 [Serendipita vermifera MAFF 305830]|uniref:Uncharacterized protein n=1 Tax=Serendipita vermifera MAFF 305830 TaxID=933852 RepID=A0A0C2XKW9_SERVB|nr:hypothetical protein M408DRAFT_105405 [Serendipita vermifera MAFF 305830]